VLKFIVVLARHPENAPVARNLSNRKRAFADVVSIDAWMGDFTKGRRVSFHADVVFGTARVGGEAASPVRFRLSVKRAEVVLVISDFEPVKVDPKAVFRGTPEPEGRVTATEERSTRANAKGEVGISISHGDMDAKAAIGAGAHTSISSQQKIEMASPVHSMHVKQSKNSEGYYRWEIKSDDEKALEGRPWNPSEPSARLIDQRSSDSTSIPPSVRVEVRCRREDLIIEELELKDENLWQEVRRRAGFKKRFAAAVSYIRDQLLEEGLYVANIDDAFGQLTLGSAIAHDS
jgi:hypothetical protein